MAVRQLQRLCRRGCQLRVRGGGGLGKAVNGETTLLGNIPAQNSDRCRCSLLCVFSQCRRRRPSGCLSRPARRTTSQRTATRRSSSTRSPSSSFSNSSSGLWWGYCSEALSGLQRVRIRRVSFVCHTCANVVSQLERRRDEWEESALLEAVGEGCGLCLWRQYRPQYGEQLLRLACGGSRGMHEDRTTTVGC